MPFHTRLLGKERLALYSFIHSLNTNFGSNIFEPVACALAKHNFAIVDRQATAGQEISQAAQREIQKIMNELTATKLEPDKLREIARIRRVARQGSMVKVRLTKVDLMLKSEDGQYFLFDLKTAKPNISGFEKHKQTLLEWVAAVLIKQPHAQVHTAIAIPYNPYEPKPYKRWTMRGLFDLKHELKVADAFWNFLVGQEVYEDLLQCFENVGIEMRQEIDDSFRHFENYS